MCAHTKKIGVAGKYGTRTGRKIRDYIKKVHAAREDSKCPTCGEKVKRKSRGIWICPKCALEFTGGAYSVKERRVRIQKKVNEEEFFDEGEESVEETPLTTVEEEVKPNAPLKEIKAEEVEQVKSTEEVEMPSEENVREDEEIDELVLVTDE